MEFRVPVEETSPTIGDLLVRAWPESDRETREHALEQGDVRVGGRMERDLNHEPEAGAVVEAAVVPEATGRGIPEAGELARGNDWIVVDKPPGMVGRVDRDDPMNPVLFLADSLGVDRETFTPAWPMPTRAGGPWLFGVDPPSARRLRADWAAGDLMVTWVALIPEPEVPQGEFGDASGWEVRYAATTIRDGVAEVQLTPKWRGDDLPSDSSPVDALLDALAERGTPVLGDRERGGYMVPGELRLRLAALYREESDLQGSWQPGERWWPADPVVPEQDEDDDEASDAAVSPDQLETPELTVDAEVLAAIREGERIDVPSAAVAGRQGRADPGSVVQLQGTDGVEGPYALVESGETAALYWSDDPKDVAEFDRAVDMRFERALARRGDLLADVASCDLFRLIHGAADGLPGLILDRVGPLLRAGLRGRAASGFRESVYDRLTERDPNMMVVQYRIDPATRRAREGSRLVRSGGHYIREGQTVTGREGGLRYVCDPWSPGVAFDASLRPLRRRAAASGEPGAQWVSVTEPPAQFTPVLAEAGATVEFCELDAPSEEARERTREVNGLANDRFRPSDLRPDELVASRDDWDGMVVDLDLFERSAGFEGPVEAVEECREQLGESGRLIAYRRPEPEEEPLVDRVGSEEVGASATVEGVEPPVDFPGGEKRWGGPAFDAVFVEWVSN